MKNEKIINILNSHTALLEGFEWDEDLCNQSQEYFLNSIEEIYNKHESRTVTDFSVDIFKNMIATIMREKVEISNNQIDLLFNVLENNLSFKLSGKDGEKILLKSIEMLVLNESFVEE